MVATRRADYLTLKAYKVWEEWVFLAHSDQNRAYLKGLQSSSNFSLPSPA